MKEFNYSRCWTEKYKPAMEQAPEEILVLVGETAKLSGRIKQDKRNLEEIVPTSAAAKPLLKKLEQAFDAVPVALLAEYHIPEAEE